MTTETEVKVYDQNPKAAPWRGHQHDGHLQRHAAAQFATAWSVQGALDELVEERAKVDQRIRELVAQRDNALAVVEALRFSEGECVSTLRTIRKEQGKDDFLSPNLDWLHGKPVPPKIDNRPRPTTWDGKTPQRRTKD